jgi:hypothetical protein
MKPAATKGLLIGLVLCGTLFAILGAAGQDEPRRGLRRLMRGKLVHSQKVLGGLALEDFAAIARGARALRELSEDTQWRVSPNVNYLRLSAEFQDLADEMADKAKARNLDGATLAYVKMTLNCVKCHKLVRDERLITLGSGRPRLRS